MAPQSKGVKNSKKTNQQTLHMTNTQKNPLYVALLLLEFKDDL